MCCAIIDKSWSICTYREESVELVHFGNGFKIGSIISRDLISGQTCLCKDPLLSQFTWADVTHITSPRIADAVKWFSKIDQSDVPLADFSMLQVCLFWCVMSRWVSEFYYSVCVYCFIVFGLKPKTVTKHIRWLCIQKLQLPHKHFYYALMRPQMVFLQRIKLYTTLIPHLPIRTTRFSSACVI